MNQKYRANSQSIIAVLFVCFLFISLHNSAIADSKRLLIYAQNTALLPQIEAILKNLRNAETDELIFSNIVNLNVWAINQDETGNLDDLIRFYESNQQLRRKAREARQSDDSLVDLIINADSYIRFDVLEKLPLLEFQLIITDSIPHRSRDEFQILVTSSTRYNGFIIDLSSDDYINQLDCNLRKLFPESNRLPQPVIQINSSRNSDGFFYYGTGNKIIIDASNSYDPDGNERPLEFIWRQINPIDSSRPISASEFIALKQGESVQEISTRNVCEFNIALVISDGISKCKEEIIKFRYIDKPIISSKSYNYSIDSYPGLKRKDRIYIPISLFVTTKDTTDLVLYKVLVQRKKDIFDIFKKSVFEYQKIDSVNPAWFDLIEESIQPQGNSRKYILNFIYPRDDWWKSSYKFYIFARNQYTTSDTIEITVDHNIHSFEGKADIVISKYYKLNDDGYNFAGERNILLNLAYKYYFSRKLSLEIGTQQNVYDENNIKNRKYFKLTSSYFSLNYSYISMGLYQAGIYGGYGWSMDFGKLLVDKSVLLEFVAFNRGWSTLSLRAGGEISLRSFMLLAISSYVLMVLS
ncbi:MAG: hypothetical protein CVT49_12720 [candidate division Zixibacteria bacterium HGW-Zixibacteria-1]|nr:MAG: hypothetical protein CVT49_12720 [candidate division Zixibacteria bacterium HGW-Zixibacteria-1]